MWPDSSGHYLSEFKTNTSGGLTSFSAIAPLFFSFILIATRFRIFLTSCRQLLPPAYYGQTFSHFRKSPSELRGYNFYLFLPMV